MQVRIIDLDGSLTAQERLDRYRPRVLNARRWGPSLRMAARFGKFRAFEDVLAKNLGSEPPAITLIGSGDFHHVTLALLRQIDAPFNLLVLDKHPDWVRGVPLLHCGTWLCHAARLPRVRRIFHLGGDLDFDNSWRWLAPWRQLREGKIVVFPAIRRYATGPWPSVAHLPLRPEPGTPVDADRLHALLSPYRIELARLPLYISVDKDVSQATEAVVNWDSGSLEMGEILTILATFRQAASRNLIGADLVGDWSPFQATGLLRPFLHWTEHPALRVDPGDARRINERANLAMLDAMGAAAEPAVRSWTRAG